MIEFIENEILDKSSDIKLEDIAGLEFAKKTIKELLILPLKRPDIFYGIRSPSKVKSINLIFILEPNVIWPNRYRKGPHR